MWTEMQELSLCLSTNRPNFNRRVDSARKN